MDLQSDHQRQIKLNKTVGAQENQTGGMFNLLTCLIARRSGDNVTEYCASK